MFRVSQMGRDVGRLIYVMGPSGAGKDSLMGWAKAHCPGDAPVVFARRYITRPLEAGGEAHVSLTEDEFVRREGTGEFALSWRSHGLCYGVGREIDAWLKSGNVVVVNGSREYFPEALRRYPNMLPVLIKVSSEVLQKRLQARGRENGCEIEERLSRNVSLVSTSAQIVTIDNSGRLEDAGEDFLQLLISIAC